MATEIITEEEIIQEIGLRYDIGPVKALQRLGPALSLVYRVDTNNDRYILKRQPSNKGLEDLKQEERVICALDAGDFPLAPQLVPTSGQHMHFCHLDHYWSMYRFIEADAIFDWTQPTWSAEHCRQSGAALAQFHGQAIQVLPKLLADHEPPSSELPIWVDDAQRQVRLWLRDSKADEPALEQAAFSDVLLESAESTINDIDVLAGELPSVLVHGDFHPGNLLFKGSEVKAIIDLEHSHADQPGCDLGYAALMFCAPWTSQGTDGELFNMEFLEALLDGYRSKLQGADSDTVQLPMLPYMRLACHLLIYWGLQRAVSQPADLRKYFSRAVEHGTRLLTELETLPVDSYTYAIGSAV